MKKYHIPGTELQVSRIALGTMNMGGQWNKEPLTAEAKSRATAIVETALEVGINHFDFADIYTMGKSDMAFGHVLKTSPHLRSQMILQAKCGIIIGADPDFGPPSRYDFSYDHIVQSVETSLKRVNTDYFDILALHRPDPLFEPEEVARAIDHLQSTGKVRHFGVSNFSAAQIALLQQTIDQKLVLNQLQFSLLHHYLVSDGILTNQSGYTYAAAHGLLDYCRAHNIMIQAWSPVAGGQLFRDNADAPDHVRHTQAILNQLASDNQTNAGAIALAWILRHPAGIQPILGTLNPQRLRDSVQADTITLSRHDWYNLLEAARGASVP